MTTIQFTPEEAWEFALSWGSLLYAGDPGACLYGFDETCRPQSESHRQQCIREMRRNRQYVEANPENYEANDIDKIDAFIEFLSNRGLEEESFYIELSSECATCCRLDGDEIDGKLLEDLRDCNSPGDNVTEACDYVLKKWKPQFVTTKKQEDGSYKSVSASYKCKLATVKSIWFETDFADADEAELNRHLVWEAATSLGSRD